jgi:hypothetical protein
MAGRTDLLHDRRAAVRLGFEFPCVLRDASFAWRGEVENISSTGALLRLPHAAPIGKSHELELRPVGRDSIRLRGKVVHLLGAGRSGFCFDVDATDDFERALDLFEWLLAQRPELAVEVKRRPVVLAKSTTLWAVPDSPVQPRPEEARFLTLFVGGRTLADAEQVLGPRFQSVMYLVFSLLDRRLLTAMRPGQFGG